MFFCVKYFKTRLLKPHFYSPTVMTQRKTMDTGVPACTRQTVTRPCSE